MAETRAPWQLKFEKVEQRCGYLLTSGLWSDCTFMVSSETDQAVVPAHKLVLAMASPVFEAMFYGGLSERNDLKISDVQPEAFRALLQYIYTGNTDIVSLDIAWGLLYGAKKYKLPHLVQECNRYICSVLAPRNVCQAYELAHLYDQKALMDKCIQIISTNTKEILNDSSFEDVELNTVITVCSLDHLNVDSELDLFHAVKKYAEAEQRKQISPVDGEPPSEKLSELRQESQTSEDKVLQSVESSSQTSPAAELHSKTPTTTDKDNSKEVEAGPTIRDAIEKIRFLSLTVKEFAAGPARSGLLTQDESFAVLMNIASRDSAVPMPAGFSESPERRQPPSDLMDPCFEVGSLDHIINELKSGNPSQVENAALATTNILHTPLEIQQALDKGILDALGAALTEGNYKCKFYATLAIRNICASGSPAQLCVLGASAALEPYCRLLADTGTRSWVLRGLADLLKKIDEKNKLVLLPKLRKIGLPQLLMKMRKDEAEQSGELPVVSIQDTEELPLGENLAEDIFAIMNSEGIQSSDDIADATDWKNIIRDIGNLQDITQLPPPLAVVDHLSPIAPHASKTLPTPNTPKLNLSIPSTTKFNLGGYDANKHCGVLTAEGKPCKRSLVCKAHAVSLRRKVEGRAKPFDTLLAEHRASRDAGAAAGPAPLVELPPLLVNNSINLSAFNGPTTEHEPNSLLANPISSLVTPLDGPFALPEDLPPLQPAPLPVERIERSEQPEQTSSRTRE